MKIILDGLDSEMGHVIVMAKNVPRNFVYQTGMLFKEEAFTSVLLNFGLVDMDEV